MNKGLISSVVSTEEFSHNLTDFENNFLFCFSMFSVDLCLGLVLREVAMSVYVRTTTAVMTYMALKAKM